MKPMKHTIENMKYESNGHYKMKCVVEQLGHFASGVKRSLQTQGI